MGTYTSATKSSSLSARILLQSIRSIDYAARYGGDEFIIVAWSRLQPTWRWKTAERIRFAGREYAAIAASGSTINVTVSIGIVQCQQDDMTPTAVFARADHALYEAKGAGRNRAYCPLLAKTEA